MTPARSHYGSESYKSCLHCQKFRGLLHGYQALELSQCPLSSANSYSGAVGRPLGLIQRYKRTVAVRDSDLSCFRKPRPDQDSQPPFCLEIRINVPRLFSPRPGFSHGTEGSKPLTSGIRIILSVPCVGYSLRLAGVDSAVKGPLPPLMRNTCNILWAPTAENVNSVLSYRTVWGIFGLGCACAFLRISAVCSSVTLLIVFELGQLRKAIGGPSSRRYERTLGLRRHCRRQCIPPLGVHLNSVGHSDCPYRAHPFTISLTRIDSS